MPQEVALARGRISDPQRPWPWTYWNHRQLVLISRSTNEHQRFSVRRPAWHRIFIDTGSDIADGGAAEIVNRDQAVPVALAHECNMLAVRRPLRLSGTSAHRSQFFGRLLSIHAGEPQFLLGRPHGHLAIGRNFNVLTTFLRAGHIA